MTFSIPKPPKEASNGRPSETPKWASRSKAQKAKSPALVLVTMAAVGGMFGVVGLPAYAASNATQETYSAIGDGQTLDVDDNAVLTVASRDAFAATTHEELQAAREAEAAAAAAAVAAAYQASRVASYVASGPRAAGDDYPWFGQEGMSPLNYYYGECVDFVAWRLNRDAGASPSGPFPYVWGTLTPGGGSAVSWTSAWQNAGRIVSNVPVPGAVAVTQYDHVAYVNSVNADGSVNIEEYNYGNYHAYNARTVSAQSVLAFLYPPG